MYYSKAILPQILDRVMTHKRYIPGLHCIGQSLAYQSLFPSSCYCLNNIREELFKPCKFEETPETCELFMWMSLMRFIHFSSFKKPSSRTVFHSEDIAA